MSVASSPDDPNWPETKKRLDAHRVNKIYRVKHNLHKLPEGPAIMQYLASAKFDGAKNLKGLLLNLKKKGNTAKLALGPHPPNPPLPIIGEGGET